MKNHKSKIMSIAAAVLFLGLGASLMLGIDEAEASSMSTYQIDIAPNFRYTYTPEFDEDLNPTVEITSQGVGVAGTGGNWATMSGKQLIVNIPNDATPDSNYQVTLRAITTNPTQTAEIKIIFSISDKMSVTGDQDNIVTGESINFTPSVIGFGDTFTWSVTAGKTLPDGLTLNTSTGKITGEPAGIGERTIYLTATSSYGETADLAVSFTIVPKLEFNDPAENGAIFYV